MTANVPRLRLLLVPLAGWINRYQQHVIEYLVEENRVLREQWSYPRNRPGRPRIMKKIARLIVRMATENPSWGYSRIQGALKNLDHRAARSTIASVLKEQGIPPVSDRPTSWRTFLRANWGKSQPPIFSLRKSGRRVGW